MVSHGRKIAKVEVEKPQMRRRGEDRDDVAIIIDCGRPNYKMSTDRIPAGRAKSVETSLRDIGGREVLVKANAIFSSKANQPILCYGGRMEHGWGING